MKQNSKKKNKGEKKPAPERRRLHPIPRWKVVAVGVILVLGLASLVVIGQHLWRRREQSIESTLRQQGSEYFTAGKFEEARICFQKLLERDDRDYLALYQKGRCDIALGDELEGFRCIRMAADLKVDFYQAQNRLAKYYLDRGDIVNARKRAELAARAPRAPAEAMLNLGNIYQLEGRPEDAISALQGAIARGSQLTQAPLALAQLYRTKAENFHLRGGYYQKYNQHQAAGIMFSRAQSCRKDAEEQFAVAQKSAHQALAHRPDDVQLLGQLATADEGLGQFELALQSMDKALQLQPDNLDLKLARAWLLMKSDRQDEAQPILEALAEEIPEALVQFYLTENHFSKAEKLMEEIARNQTTSAGVWINWGDLCAWQGKLQEAVAKYRQALARDDNNVEARARIARLCLDNLEAFPEAQATARRYTDEIVALDPGEPMGITLKGRLALVKGDLEEALNLLKQAAQLLPTDARTHYFLGIARAESGFPSEAEQDLKRAMQIKPFFPEAQNALSGVRLEQARKLIAGGELESACLKLGLAYQDDPGETEVMRLLALTLPRVEKPEEAEQWAQKVLDRLPQDTEMLQLVGELELRSRQFDEAADTFRKLVETEPDNPINLLRLGQTYARDGKLGQAEQALKRTLELAGKAEEGFEISVVAAYSLVEIYRVRGQTELAILTVSQFPADDTRCASLQFLLGNTYIILKRHDLAIQALERAAAWPEAPPEYFHDLALAYARAGRLEEGKQKAYEQLKAHPHHPRLHLLLGIIHQMQSDLSGATEHYRSAIEADPDGDVATTAGNNLAMLFADQGKHLEEAERFALQAVSRYPDNPLYRDTLGWVYFKQAKYEQAESNLLKAYRKLPDRLEVTYHLGMDYYKLGKEEEAIEMLEKVRSLLEAAGRYRKHPYQVEIEKALKELGSGLQSDSRGKEGLACQQPSELRRTVGAAEA